MAYQSIPITATGQALAAANAPTILQGAKLVAAAAAATAILYDGTDNTGPVLVKLSAAATGSDDVAVPVLIHAGVYVELTGAGAVLNVFV
ncbi:MAG: hypothetical protein KJ018_22565 [Burkholderiales bacterium]|nr:hypothetical protein [Burkholderiales bacterium]